MDNTHFITLQVSAQKYWGYRYKVPMQYALSVTNETLIQELKISMRNFFELHNLLELRDGLKNLNLHIDGCVQHKNTVIFACDHRHEQNTALKKNKIDI